MRLDPEYPIGREYYRMDFPSRWREPLRKLTKAGRRADGAVRVPIAALNEAITAVVPHCIVTGQLVLNGDHVRRWLLADRPINPHVIFKLVTAWVAAQPATRAEIESALSQLDVDDLVWSSARIGSDLSLSELARLVPLHVATMLCQPNAPLPFENLRFVRCPAADGAELMSWPPRQVENGEPYSITVGIRMQTVPGSHEIFVNLSFGVRRWAPRRMKLTQGRSYPVYLAPADPYLDGLDRSRHFGIAKIKLAPASKKDYPDVSFPQWHQPLAAVLERAGCLGRLPKPSQLVATPSQLLGDHDAAALASGIGTLSVADVSMGLSVLDRAPLMSWVTDALAPHLRPVGPLPRVRGTVYKGLASTANGVVSLDTLRHVIGERLSIELFTESEASTQNALDRLGERLGLELPRADALDEVETLLEVGSMTIGLRRVRRSVEHEGLGNGPKAAIEVRADVVAGLLGHTGHPTITLVEVPSSKQPGSASHDADRRLALRHRLSLAGRLSYVVTSPVDTRTPSRLPARGEASGSSRSRISLAVDDLFRQLGMRPATLPAPAPDTLERPPALLAVWLIRQRDRTTQSSPRQVPVAVLADPTGQQVLMCTPAMSWMPLHAGFLEISRTYGSARHLGAAEDTARFIEEVVNYAVAQYSDTLLLTHAQNLRGEWTFLANSNLQVDTMEFASGSPLPIHMFPGLRHVRVRTAERRETPDCYGVNDETVGQPTGLWEYQQPRLFGSTSGKPAKAAQTSMGVSKIEAGVRHGRLARLSSRAQVWNDEFVELFVAGLQLGDEPKHWAALAHDLRSAQPFANWATVLPWPLHLAQRIGEYLPPPDSALRHNTDLRDSGGAGEVAGRLALSTASVSRNVRPRGLPHDR